MLLVLHFIYSRFLLLFCFILYLILYMCILFFLMFALILWGPANQKSFMNLEAIFITNNEPETRQTPLFTSKRWLKKCPNLRNFRPIFGTSCHQQGHVCTDYEFSFV